MEMLYSQYRQLLLLDKTRFYNIFKEEYPLVLLAFMANRSLRNCFFCSVDEVNQVYDDVLPKNKDKQSVIDANWETISDDVYRGNTPDFSVVQIKSEEQLKKFKIEYEGRKLYPFNYNTRYPQRKIDVSSFKVYDFYCPKEIEIQIEEEQNSSKRLPPHIKIFSGKTDQYWKDIEPKGKSFMIISMEEGNKVRNSGVNGEEYSADDINGKFQFTDGIDYMSNSDTDKLIYMEI
ncbi:MAG: hypothetical protein K6G18_09885 [Treponema sp.]|nr:hypothetical protein [Treponema sp.]